MELDDKELYESALSDAPTETPAAEVPAEPEGQLRDEHGRFAAKAVEPEAPAVVDPAQAEPTTQQPAQQEEAAVPSWRLREIRERAEAAESRSREFERQIEQLRNEMRSKEPKPEPVNIFENPDGFISNLQQTTEQRLANQRFEFSEMLARQASGDAKVDEALAWSKANLQPADQVRINNARHPYAEMIRIMDERKVLSEIGTDPNAYKAKLMEELLNNPEFLGKAAEKIRGGVQGQKPANVVSIPPSINRAPSAGNSHEDPGSMNDADLYSYATR